MFHSGKDFTLVLDVAPHSMSCLREAVELHTQCSLGEFELKQSTKIIGRTTTSSGPGPFHYYFNVGVLSVKTLTGKVIPVEIQTYYTVEAVIKYIHDREHVPPDIQRLLFNEKQLDNGIIPKYIKYWLH